MRGFAYLGYKHGVENDHQSEEEAEERGLQAAHPVNDGDEHYGQNKLQRQICRRSCQEIGT